MPLQPSQRAPRELRKRAASILHREGFTLAQISHVFRQSESETARDLGLKDPGHRWWFECDRLDDFSDAGRGISKSLEACRGRYRTIGDVLQATDFELMSIPWIGPRAAAAVKERLRQAVEALPQQVIWAFENLIEAIK